jgi:replicative DNA helicase
MSLDIETYLLAALLADASVAHRVEIDPEHFRDERNASLCRAIHEFDASGQKRDPVTLIESLPKHQQSFATSVWDSHYSSANVEAYAAKVRELWKVRQAKAIAHALADSGNEDGIDAAIRDLMALNASRRKSAYTVKEMLKLSLAELDRVYTAQGKIPGVPTGITKLDTILGGLHPQDLVIVGARPAVGKTAFMLNIASHAGAPVGIISAEQGVVQIGARLISINGNVSSDRMRRGSIDDGDWGRITDASAKLVETPVFVYDKPGASITDVVRQCRAWVHVEGVKALYVDYLQRLKVPGNGPKHERVGDCAQALKELARELSVPVVALAQVSRQVEQRDDKRPRMGDLSDSSEIEKEADQILTLYRDDVYNPDSQDRGTAEILVEKNRHGPTGFVRCAWVGEYLKFADLEYGA